MAKKWMKFDCRNQGCGLENWIFEDPESFSREKIILSCCECGAVLGWVKSVEEDDNGQSCCTCIKFNGTEKGTNGPHGACPMDDSTLWATFDGKMLSRNDFMLKFGKDPWVDWCKKHPDSPFCEGFKERCKNRKAPVTTPEIPLLPITRRIVRFKPRSTRH